MNLRSYDVGCVVNGGCSGNDAHSRALFPVDDDGDAGRVMPEFERVQDSDESSRPCCCGLWITNGQWASEDPCLLFNVWH